MNNACSIHHNFHSHFTDYQNATSSSNVMYDTGAVQNQLNASTNTISQHTLVRNALPNNLCQAKCSSYLALPSSPSSNWPNALYILSFMFSVLDWRSHWLAEHLNKCLNFIIFMYTYLLFTILLPLLNCCMCPWQIFSKLQQLSVFCGYYMELASLVWTIRNYKLIRYSSKCAL